MAEISVFKTLEPCSKQTPRPNPLLSGIFIQKNIKKWPIKVKFPGCRKPHQSWANWVEKLSIKYAKLWELTGICDGILSSLHEIKPNPEIILAISEFWCSETNTFMFPWGEASITLEDIIVLFGLPVLGENVDFFLCEGLSKNMEQKLQQVKTAMSIFTCEVDAWIKYFNDEKDEIEHVGFLAYWLSMFVFPDLSDRTIGNHVFSVAVNLAQGVKIALAPAVLACLYQNLTFITKHAADFDSAKKEISVPAPFQIVQLWAFERFPWLGSKLAKPLNLGHPRIARWDNVSCKANLVDVRKALISSADSFCWQPYASDLENWHHNFLCIDNEKILSSEYSSDVDEELKSFRVCLQPQELIGIDCTATYQPQRVLMQFGSDQKVHAETAFISPPESGNNSKSAHEIAIVEGFEQKKNDEDNHQKSELDRDEADVSPESKILNVSGDDNGTKQSFYERNEEQSMEEMVILQPQELIGIDCTATYQPQRVLMQFGCDQKVHAETAFVSPSESGNNSKSAHEIAIVEGFEQKKNDEDNHQKSELNRDEADVSPESEILNVLRDENGTKQSFRERNEQSMEEMVILDSDDDEMTEKLRCRDVIQSRRKRLKRRLGDSADYPLFINEYSRKVVKKSGVSFGNPIDVENY